MTPRKKEDAAIGKVYARQDNTWPIDHMLNKGTINNNQYNAAERYYATWKRSTKSPQDAQAMDYRKLKVDGGGAFDESDISAFNSVVHRRATAAFQSIRYGVSIMDEICLQWHSIRKYEYDHGIDRRIVSRTIKKCLHELHKYYNEKEPRANDIMNDEFLK